MNNTPTPDDVVPLDARRGMALGVARRLRRDRESALDVLETEVMQSARRSNLARAAPPPAARNKKPAGRNR